jgi:tRNA (cmo5U34)-methyltransferase
MSGATPAEAKAELAGFDAGIRRLLPGYDLMVAEALEVLERHLGAAAGPRVLDVGTGSGRMAEALLRRFPAAQLTLLDTSPDALEKARVRLEDHRHRASFIEGSFSQPLPPCDLAVASLSLHCVLDPGQKVKVYANLRAALPPGGLLVVADAMIPSDPELARRAMHRWSEHLVRGGDTVAEAFARFAQWAEAERYFSIEEEFSFLRAAGFTRTDVAWRQGPLAVLAALS